MPTVLDLFCGAGGLALGFADAGYRVLGGIDCWEPAVDSFKANLPGTKGLVADLRSCTAAEVKETFGSNIDVIVGGPSCQGFSTSGGLTKASGRDEKDPRNKLFLNYLSIVEGIQPSWVVFENVPGLLLYHQGRVALEIVKAFREIGYSMVPMILLAADYGVPQLRRRLVFVGNRTGSPMAFPAATHGNPDLWKNYALPFAHLSRIGHGRSRAHLPHVSFADACSDLPAVDEGAEIDGVAYATGPLTEYQAFIRRNSAAVRQHAAATLATLDRFAASTLKPGQNWRNLPIEALPDRFRRIRPYDATTMLKRLRDDQPAYTITTKFNEGTTGAFIHPSQPRTLTLREAARIQSFPDTFIFSGSPSQVRHQIGNAVPPLLAQRVGEAILPLVMRDIGGPDVPQKCDVIEIDNRVNDGDILRLRAPRKQKADASGEDLCAAE